jgi:2-(1,2-epoxy-1,2-dihydrophenyl)acetyl-CoA isomerase
VGGIRVHVDEGVATITLSRPEVSNAVDLDTARDLAAAIESTGADDRVSSILVAGGGRRFCAGGDVASMVAADDQATYLEELAGALDGALVALHGLAKPVVAAVQGAVAGAGLAVMLSCDLIISDSSTRFVAAYAGVGLTPDCGLSWLLPRAVGQQRALELLLTPRTLTAGEALDWGLVSSVVEDGTAGTVAHDLARRLASGPTFALGQARRMVRNSWEVRREEAGRDETSTIARAVVDPEAVRLLARFGQSA